MYSVLGFSGRMVYGIYICNVLVFDARVVVLHSQLAAIALYFILYLLVCLVLRRSSWGCSRNLNVDNGAIMQRGEDRCSRSAFLCLFF